MRSAWLLLLGAGCGFQIGSGSPIDSAPPQDRDASIDAAIDAEIDAPMPDAPPDARPAACLTSLGYTTRPGSTHRYRVVTTIASWQTAKAACETDEAHLVIIGDELENTYVDGLSTSSFWIGMSDLVTEGDWRWVDGTVVMTGYNSWRDDQPNNDSGTQHCGEMDPDSDGTWNDFACTPAQGYICECE